MIADMEGKTITVSENICFWCVEKIAKNKVLALSLQSRKPPMILN